MSSDGLGPRPSHDPGTPAGAEEREGALERLLHAAAVTVPWLIAIYAGFDIYIYIVYPHATLDRLGPVLGMLFSLIVAAPTGVALGCSTRLRRPMGIIGLALALLVGGAAAVGHLVFRWH